MKSRRSAAATRTSAFLATDLVIRDPNVGWKPCSGEAQLTQWLSQPKIFEIERTGAVLPFPGGEAVRTISCLAAIFSRPKRSSFPSW